MPYEQEQLERVIVRSLDGELSADEQLALDRELIRNPHARRMMDDYRRVDALCGATLGAMAEAEFRLRPVGQACGERRSWRLNRFWFVPGAIAAALLALLMPRLDQTEIQPSAVPPPRVADWGGEQGGMIRPVSTSSSLPSVHRATGRELMGVMGEDGNIYWIEVERIRTVRLPNGNLGGTSNRF